MSLPDSYKYTKEHEWVSLEGGVATVGITEYAQSELGEVVFVEVPEEGATLTKGDTLCVVESTKAASDVYSPVGGKVTEGNSALDATPELVNSAPFTEGWMAKLEGVTEADLADLMSASEYQEFIGQ